MRHSPVRLTICAFLLSALVLAGCGDSPPVRSGSASPTTARPVALPPDLPEGRGVVTENVDGTRTVSSAWGTAVVPARPERVVSVLGYIDFETMLALGVTPVGAGTQGGTVASGFAPHLEGRTDGVVPLAWADGAPVEAIAALDPDLIFATDKESADLLAEIAPTVPAGAADGQEWKDDAHFIAAVLGLDDEADGLIRSHEDAAAELGARLGPVIAGRTVASPQVASDHTQVYVDPPSAFSSAVLTEVGFTLAPLVTESTEDEIAVSFERLPEIDADILFWQVRQRDEDGTRDAAGFEAATDSPLWGRVPAVEAGAVYQVDNRPWYFPTILAAEQMLTDIEGALLGG